MSLESSAMRERLTLLLSQVMDPGSPVPKPFPVDRQLNELGVTSLNMLNLMLAVEAEFDLAIPQVEITPENFRSLASIQSMLERIRPGSPNA